jgi:hypothetical protein
MASLQETLGTNRTAVEEFQAAARTVPDQAWAQPTAPGKWTPAQIVEHVALAYELSLAALRGHFPGKPMPRLLRPIIRTFFFKPVISNGRFASGAKSPGPFQPSPSPGPAERLIPRVRAASDSFELAVAEEQRMGRTTLDHPFFGRIPLIDYVLLQTVHTRHHHAQLPGVRPR